MQNFMPYEDWERSAASLDNKRLGKQRVETWQMLRAVLGEPSRWLHSPAAKMWIGYEIAFAEYGRLICLEWRRRGFQDTMLPRFEGVIADLKKKGKRYEAPPWLGDERIHGSHRGNLLRKDPAFYGRYGWTDDPTQPYYWPVQGKAIVVKAA